MSNLANIKNDPKAIDTEIRPFEQNPKAFDFETNPIQRMSIATLKKTHREDDIYGKPVRGIYPHEAIERVVTMCGSYNLSSQIDNIFAAQNKNKIQPGVAILPMVEAVYGPKAIEAHILRRVFTTIQIKDGETDELTTTLAIAFHQDGIQMAIGPCVKICYNQCILSPERTISNYGKGKVSTEDLFAIVSEWLKDFHGQMGLDRERIQRMKDRVLSADEILQMIGLLQVYRVAHDCKDKNISDKSKAYPLNQGQISVFTEDLLKLQHAQSQITVWDVYNVATNLYKPGRTDVPVIISQNVILSEILSTHWGV